MEGLVLLRSRSLHARPLGLQDRIIILNGNSSPACNHHFGGSHMVLGLHCYDAL